MAVGIEQVGAALPGVTVEPVPASFLRAFGGLVLGVGSGIAAARAREAAVEEWFRRFAEYFPSLPPAPTVGGGDDAPRAAPPQMLPMWAADP